MQALQSISGVEARIGSGKFAALRHVTGEMISDKREEAGARQTAKAAFEGTDLVDQLGVAEGAGLAHDAGNLLGALSLYSDLLAMPGVLHEEHRAYASELRMLSDRSWAMIDRLVNHARARRVPALSEQVSVLPDVVDRCRGVLSRIAGRSLDVSYGLGAFQPVPVPAESVERILTNLVKNAAEATPWVGTISIHVEGIEEPDESKGPKPRRVALTVSDQGCGMDAATVRRLMHSGVSRRNGRGLGFRVVRELAAVSGGHLRVESRPELGTSISAEWTVIGDAVGLGSDGKDGEIELEEHARGKALAKPESEWIACQTTHRQ